MDMNKLERANAIIREIAEIESHVEEIRILAFNLDDTSKLSPYASLRLVRNEDWSELYTEFLGMSFKSFLSDYLAFAGAKVNQLKEEFKEL